MRFSLRKAMLPVIALVVLCGAVPLKTIAKDKAVLSYDWTVRVETEQLERQFEYKDSRFTPIDIVGVDYYPQDEDDKLYAYEKVWFHAGRALGLERIGKLAVPQAEGICILIAHRKESMKASEEKAAANMIMRIWLDACLNKNPVQVIKIPANNFNSIVSELQATQGCRAVAGPQAEIGSGDIMTTIAVSEPEGQKVRLIYE